MRDKLRDPSELESSVEFLLNDSFLAALMGFLEVVRSIGTFEGASLASLIASPSVHVIFASGVSQRYLLNRGEQQGSRSSNSTLQTSDITRRQQHHEIDLKALQKMKRLARPFWPYKTARTEGDEWLMEQWSKL